MAVLKRDQNVWTIAKAKLDYQWAVEQLAQAKQLHQQGGLAAQAVAAQQLKQKQAHITWQEALHLEHQRWIIAPDGGLVAQLSLETETPVIKGQSALLLIQADDLKAQLFIPADQMHQIHPKVFVETHRLANGRKLPGYITRISPFVDPASGTCQVEALFPGAGIHARPGQVVQIRIEENREEE